jgi:hypothetical protein
MIKIRLSVDVLCPQHLHRPGTRPNTRCRTCETIAAVADCVRDVKVALEWASHEGAVLRRRNVQRTGETIRPSATAECAVPPAGDSPAV